MRALAALVVLAAGCGRFGFADGELASDATSTDVLAEDASEDALVPSNVIRIVARRATSGAIVPIVDGFVVAVDGNGEHTTTTDGDGRAEIEVDGMSTIHVAFPGDSSGTTIVSYQDVPAGVELVLGATQNRGSGSNVKNFPLPVYEGASGYNTILPDVCGTSGYSDDPVAVASYPPACVGRDVPTVFLARSGAGTLAAFVADTHSENTTSVTGTWGPLTTHEIAVAAVPGYAFSYAATHHRIGTDTITLTSGQATYAAGVARVNQLAHSVERVEVHFGSGAVTHTQLFDVPPAVGTRSAVDPAKAMTALGSVSRDGADIRWTIGGAAGARDGSFVMTREFYGSTIHYTYAPPSRLSTTRARLPAPYDTLADGAPVGSAEATMYLVGTQDYASALPRMDANGRGGDIYWLDSEYGVNHRLGSN